MRSLIRQTAGGRNYRSGFGTRMRGTGHIADLIANRFRQSHRRLGFEALPGLDSSRFQPPGEYPDDDPRAGARARAAEAAGQLALPF